MPEELKLRIGAFLLLEEDGHPCLDTGYYPEPSNEPQEPPASGGADAGADQGVDGDGGGAADQAGVAAAAIPGQLLIQRHDILAVHVRKYS